MDIDSLIDFANEAIEDIGRYRIPVTLSPVNMTSAEYVVNPLVWKSIPYGDDELDKVPDDKRGVYAFAVCEQSRVLPPHGYVLYMGIAGKDSNRPLRERYRDYLNERKVRKRERIMFMIGNWHKVLRFFFAPVDDCVSSEDLKKLEIQLNTALQPPYSVNDLEAETKRKQRAFR